MKIPGSQTNSVVPQGGANQVRVRAYNERLVLSLVRLHEKLSKSEIAKLTSLSTQTVTVIMRAMEEEGLLLKGTPQRGKVGQPSVPMSLNPVGVFSIGLKIGRRSAELVLIDFLGTVRMRIQQHYQCPLPSPVLDFTLKGIVQATETLEEDQRKRIAGVGIAMPFELWNWVEKLGVESNEMDDWLNIDFASEVANHCGYPVYVQNDATSACRAELTFGDGAKYHDFLYIYIGMFIGGGVVLNQTVQAGRTGYAGAIGAMPVKNKDGTISQLIDHASLFELEKTLAQHRIDPARLWQSTENWNAFEPLLSHWIASTAQHLAATIVSGCSFLDFEAVIIDGSLPVEVKTRIIQATVSEMQKLDLRGIITPQVCSGVVGPDARAIGGACLPLHARYLMDRNVLFKDVGSMN
ncbi:sugar kinase [Chromatiales bacterium (ex Bugula neritina AB1)]|nr:sugar kinase [Chromatiales bacterium (ex Bugula neritina AB1)]